MSQYNPNDDPYTDDTIPLSDPRAARRVPPSQRTPPMHSPPQRQRPNVPPPAPRGAAYQQPRDAQRAARSPLKVRRPRSIRSWLRGAVLLIVAAVILSLVGTIVLQQRVAGQVALADARGNRPPGQLLFTPMNILLLGVDLRADHPDEGVRSDTLMVLHLDPAGGWGSMLSIPRDTWTTIPGMGENKINAAFADGYNNPGDGVDQQAAGAALAADTVEQFLGLRQINQRIDYVATINFNGFASMIDAVGGIDVDVPREIVDTEYPTEDFGITTIRIPAGRQHMDGQTALQYVRTRHADSDFGRAQRQQQVIRAIVQALRDQPLPLRPVAALRLIDAAGAATRTTLPVGRIDALVLGALLARFEPDRIAQYRLSPDDVAVQEIGSNLVWNQAGVQALISQMFTPPGETQEQATVQVQNGAGVGGVAGAVSNALATQEFTLAAASNAASREQSLIIDYGDHPATIERLQQALGNMPVEQQSAADAPPGVNIVVLLGSDYTTYWQP